MKKRTVGFMILFISVIIISSTINVSLSKPNTGPIQGCSSFCLSNPVSCVFGANLDIFFKSGLLFVNKRNMVKTGWEMGTTGKIAKWTSQYGSLSFNIVGYQMAWGGMNEAGLIISTLNLPRKTKMPIPDQRPQLNGPFWVQYQLDNCATVAEVIASDSRVRIAPNEQVHYLVCDKKGNCAVIEFLGGKMVNYTGGDLPVNVLTNSVYKESLDAWRAKKNQSEDSLRRFALAADELGKKHTFTDSRKMVDYAFQVLSLVSRSDTVWSIVFDNQEFQVYFISQGNQQRRWIDFKKLDFSSKTPVQMLDVFTPLAGNINNSLLPYSHQACLEQMKKAFHELAPSLSANDIKSLLSTVESFPYAKIKENSTKEQ